MHIRLYLDRNGVLLFLFRFPDKCGVDIWLRLYNGKKANNIIYDSLNKMKKARNTKHQLLDKKKFIFRLKKNEEPNLHTSKSRADKLLASSVSFYKAIQNFEE